MLSGFALLDESLMATVGGGNPLWSVIDVRFGQQTNRNLHVLLERGETHTMLVFGQPVSFMAHADKASSLNSSVSRRSGRPTR